MLFLLVFILTIIFIITLLLIFIVNLVSKKTFFDREKCSPFECGFDPKSSARLPFSMHFFLIAMIFLIFDVEITLIFPFIVILKSSNILNYWILLTFFIIILLIGLYHEWNQGALNWLS
uniref:NADH dehydrogenase subunit 3 n=1 Tax=Aegialites californicus TaxID=3056834 RepID=UPI00286ADA55|nr:NADH dehydrogenase subunit 3 [Aegialites californicus]WKT09005.1 NADH dehydrogenase subunit 3 [Aegialites californicus]